MITPGIRRLAFQRDSWSQFESNPALDHRVGRWADADGNPIIYVLSPGRMKEVCINCHNSYGMDTFKDRKEGDLVAAFGVSMSTAELYRTQRNIRIIPSWRVWPCWLSSAPS